MIDKKISVSEQVADLSVEAQLIFTWSIPHTDDVGVLPHKSRSLKALIVPMWDCEFLDFDKWIKEIVNQKLWREIEYNGKKFYVVIKFQEHQTLKKDRQPYSLFDIANDKDPKVSWNKLYAIMDTLGFQMENTDFQMDTKGKISEKKGSKGKRSEDNIKSYSLDFNKFWKIYPNKKGKGKAFESWEKINPSKKLVDKILKAIDEQKESLPWTRERGKFIPHPTTWLNQNRWDDEVNEQVADTTVDKI